MKPGRYNFTGQKAGSRFSEAMSFCDENGVAVDLSTGYTAVMEIERVGMPNVKLRVSSATAAILLSDGTQPHNILLDFDLKLRAGDYTYDLVLLTVDGKKWPVLTGDFEVEASTV